MGGAATAHASYGVDTDARLTAQSALQLRAANYQGNPLEFVARYLSIGAEGGEDLTAEEVGWIMAANLALLVVQHVRNPDWVPSADQGTKDGAEAGKNAEAVGYTKGCHIVVDLEGVEPGTSADVVIGYVNAWATAILAAGYQPMLYVGYSTMLTSEQLYEALPDITAYWSDFAARQVAVRGFCMKQLTNTTTIPGVPFQVDPDKIMADDMGDLPVWMVKEAA